MTSKLRSFPSSTLFGLTCATAVAAALAGCSSDASRFGDGFGARSDLTPTASIPEGAALAREPAFAGVPSAAPIESHPLSAPGAAPFAPPPKFAPRAQAAVALPPPPAGQNFGAWSAQGGTPITVQPGETLAILSNRYGVPPEALLHVNGLSSGAQVQSGARLYVPVYGATRAAAPKAEPPHAEAAPRKETPSRQAEAPSPPPSRQALAHVRPGAAAAPADGRDGKLAFVKGPDGKSAKLAEAEKKLAAARSKVADAKVVAPKGKSPDEAPKPKVKTADAAPPAKLDPAPAPKAAPEIKKANVDRDTPTASLPPAADPAPSAADTPEFRWPAHGRVIQGFKAGANDGINIALPEGTSVKAAEGGVVAYAGSELKGYGNLVLIRHPNGYTTAYANNGEIDVKRGDTIKRGQVIAKSGQSGNVASPQLHFELRKGSTPVDPSTFLAGT